MRNRASLRPASTPSHGGAMLRPDTLRLAADHPLSCPEIGGITYPKDLPQSGSPLTASLEGPAVPGS